MTADTLLKNKQTVQSDGVEMWPMLPLLLSSEGDEKAQFIGP